MARGVGRRRARRRPGLVYLLDGERGSTGYGARYLHHGLYIRPDGEAEEIHPLLDEMNDDSCIDAYRVVVFTGRTPEGIAALIRYELEHARQRDAHGQRLTGLYDIAPRTSSPSASVALRAAASYTK